MSDFTEQLDHDLAAIFFTDWSREATYTPSGGTAKTIKVIFDCSYLAVDPDTQTKIMSTEPMLLAQAADLPDAENITQDDRFVIDGKNFRPVEPRPDGQGLIEIILEAV